MVTAVLPAPTPRSLGRTNPSLDHTRETSAMSDRLFVIGCVALLASAGLRQAAVADEAAAETTPAADSTPKSNETPRPPPSRPRRPPKPSPRPQRPSRRRYPPYADVIKDFESVDGLFKLHTKGSKLLAELSSSHLNRDFIVLISIAKGIGQRHDEVAIEMTRR